MNTSASEVLDAAVLVAAARKEKEYICAGLERTGCGGDLDFERQETKRCLLQLERNGYVGGGLGMRGSRVDLVL